MITERTELDTAETSHHIQWYVNTCWTHTGMNSSHKTNTLILLALAFSWIYSMLKIALRGWRDGSGPGVLLFRLICKWRMFTVYVPDGFSFLSLQQWVLWWTDRQQWEVLFLKLIENQRCLQEHFDLNRLRSKGVEVIEEGDGGIETNSERKGDAGRERCQSVVRTDRPQGDNSFHEMVFHRG